MFLKFRRYQNIFMTRKFIFLLNISTMIMIESKILFYNLYNTNILKNIFFAPYMFILKYET